MAPVAAGAHGQVMQLDQKKVPVFYREKDKVTINVIAWCQHIEGMKDAFGWSDEVTYANASAALFGIAQRTADNWAVLYPEEHAKTWTYLKKMLSHYGHMQDSRSFVDAMLGIRPGTNTFDNIHSFTADCVNAFRIVRETMAKPERPPYGNCTADQCHVNYPKIDNNALDQICMAFMIKLLSPVVKS